MHLPDDFSSLPFSKREEIVDWVRRVIISGTTDYRRYQAKASKQSYAIRFPGVTYGGGSLSPREHSLAENINNTAAESFEDPDLLSGVVDAPRLALEMADLIRFKTSTLTAIGLQRNGVWGEETASQKIEHLGLMFGALAASPAANVKGRGVPLSQLTFGLLIFPGVWDWYLQWREQRRGFYTKWEEDMLMVAQSLTRSEVGWSDRDSGWDVLIPSVAFKNSGSSFFGQKPFRLILPDLSQIEAIARRFDVAGRDERNRSLSKAGEERVFHHERAHLAASGRRDLAAKVRWVSQEDGDGAGYDIASFAPDGFPRLIEVKTTNGWERTPFYISRNELEVANARRHEWNLVRLFDFFRDARAFEFRPPLEAHVSLMATQFQAAFN